MISDSKVSQSGKKLGSWVVQQRQKKEFIPQERIILLDRIGFIWDPNEQFWEEGFVELKRYQKENQKPDNENDKKSIH